MLAGVAKFLRGGGRVRKKQPTCTPPLVSLPASSPSTSRFFFLPLELRVQIYYYALLHPQEGAAISPDNVHVKCRKGNLHDYGWRSDWWGTERMSRLLRVNPQIYYEATEVFYTRFAFLFNCNLGEVQSFLQPLSPRVCRLIRWLRLLVTLDMRSFDLAKGAALNSSAFALLTQALPALRSVSLHIAFVGEHATDALRDYMVEQALNFAWPFRGVPLLVLESDDEVRWPRRAEIVQKCRERIQAGSW